MAYKRLDVLLAEASLANSRAQAARLISDGLVRVNGRKVLKPAIPVSDHDRLELIGSKYVSRSALKLKAALEEFGLDTTGVIAMDVGAGAGGFSEVLLEFGARSVVTVDVGHLQLAKKLRTDSRIISAEGLNARHLDQQRLRELSQKAGGDIELIVADVSFISLTQILPNLVETVSGARNFLLLVKPQFEVGRIGKGVVQDPKLHDRARDRVVDCARELGLSLRDSMSCPRLGRKGNQEFMLWFIS